MEREQERLKEREPLEQDYILEERLLWLRREETRKASLPHVVKYGSVPWKQTSFGWDHKYYWPIDHWKRFSKAPIASIAPSEQVIPPLSRNGRHRHVREAIFYIIEGRGYDIHDGKRFDWEAGDIMIVPSFCDHQHFSNEENKLVRMWYAVSPVLDFLSGNWVEQIEAAPRGYQIPPGAVAVHDEKGQLVGWRRDGEEFRLGSGQEYSRMFDAYRAGTAHVDQPRDTYEWYMKLLEEEASWRLSVPHVVHAEEVPWERTRMGRMKFLVNSSTYCGLKTFDAFVQEIPPGGSSGKHYHFTEEVHKILQGHGYDVHDGVRWDWEVEDVVCIPAFAVHQHFNVDAKRPARFVAFQSRWFAHMGHGGIAHLEDASG